MFETGSIGLAETQLKFYALFIIYLREHRHSPKHFRWLFSHIYLYEDFVQLF